MSSEVRQRLVRSGKSEEGRVATGAEGEGQG